MRLKNFSGYEIYPEEGKVFSLKTNKFIGAPNDDGYYKVTLTDDNGEQHSFRRCRLIWTAANGAIPENMQINHKNEVVWDDRLENIEICTPAYNCNYGTRNQRAAASRDYQEISRKRSEKQSKQVGAYQNGVLVMVFPSTAEAGRNGFSQGNVARCCNGKRQSHKGYQWKFLN